MKHPSDDQVRRLRQLAQNSPKKNTSRLMALLKLLAWVNKEDTSKKQRNVGEKEALFKDSSKISPKK